MGILVKAEMRVLCFQGQRPRAADLLDAMRRAGTEVVGVVLPEGGAPPESVPVFDTAAQAVHETGANAALVEVSPAVAADSMMEAIDANLPLIVCSTRSVPVRDMVKVINYLQGSADLGGPRHKEGKLWLLGPGSTGVITPGTGMVGRFDVEVFRPGRVAVVSRSNRLAEEAAAALTDGGIGQSTCVVTSTALIAPTRLADVLGMLEADPETEVIVLLGSVGGQAELEAATFLREAVTKPVVAYLPGRSAPWGIDIGADGDFACARANEIEEKAFALREAGAVVVSDPDEIPDAVARRL